MIPYKLFECSKCRWVVNQQNLSNLIVKRSIYCPACQKFETFTRIYCYVDFFKDYKEVLLHQYNFTKNHKMTKRLQVLAKKAIIDTV